MALILGCSNALCCRCMVRWLVSGYLHGAASTVCLECFPGIAVNEVACRE